MGADPLSDQHVVDAWANNASPWIAAIRERQIESRNLCTNQAVIDAVLSVSPQSVLDVGCGEGWLAHALIDHGLTAAGVDAIPELIEAAKASGGGDFRVMSYEQIAAGELSVKVDVAVCNFSLIGKEPVEGVVRSAPALLNPGGWLIIQTLHPAKACGESPYEDGWRKGSWAGFNDDFSDPPPWYFRTLESWVRLLSESGFRLRELREPVHPDTQQPLSVLMMAQWPAG